MAQRHCPRCRHRTIRGVEPSKSRSRGSSRTCPLGTVKSQYVYAAGTVTSANDVLKAAEKAIVHEFAVGDLDAEECIQEARKRVDKGYPIRVYSCSNGAYCTTSSWAPWQIFRHAVRMSCCPPALESVEEIVATAYHDLKHLGKPGCGCFA